MAIISFDKDTLINYVPAYAGNRDSEDPCVVRLRFVPYGKILEYRKVIEAKSKGGDPEKLLAAAREVQRKQFIENVESVSGYIVSGNEVTDPAAFYDTADHDLIIEIIRAMESAQRLTEGQIKN